MSLKGSLIPGTLPPGFCGITQDAYNTIIGLTTVLLPMGTTFYNFGNTPPTANNQQFPWFATNIDGTPDRWYVFVNGSWISQHPLLPGFGMFYRSTITDIAAFNTFLATLDGGDTQNPSLIAGPFWAEDPTYRGRFLMHPNGTSHLAGATGGEETHTQTLNELVAHTHTGQQVTAKFLAVKADDGCGGPAYGPSVNSSCFDTNDHALAGSVGGSAGGGQPFNVLPPYIAVYFIYRTGRLYYRR